MVPVEGKVFSRSTGSGLRGKHSPDPTWEGNMRLGTMTGFIHMPEGSGCLIFFLVRWFRHVGKQGTVFFL